MRIFLVGLCFLCPFTVLAQGLPDPTVAAKTARELRDKHEALKRDQSALKQKIEAAEDALVDLKSQYTDLAAKVGKAGKESSDASAIFQTALRSLFERIEEAKKILGDGEAVVKERRLPLEPVPPSPAIVKKGDTNKKPLSASPTRAILVVTTHPDAIVHIDNYTVEGKGAARTFRTPELVAGVVYRVDVSAVLPDGQTAKKEIDVKAGETVKVDLRAAK